MSHSVEERDVIYYPRESLQIRQIEMRVKSKLCSDFFNFDERTFKSHSGTHGDLLNHVEKNWSKIPSPSWSPASPPWRPPSSSWSLTHWYPQLCQIFTNSFLRGSVCLHDCLTEIWRSSDENWKCHKKFSFLQSWISESAALSPKRALDAEAPPD